MNRGSQSLVILTFWTATVVGRGETKATVCELLDKPAQFSGRMVEVRAELVEPRRIQIVDPLNKDCGRIPWIFPGDRNIPRARFKLIEDKKYVELTDSIGLMLPPPPSSTRVPSRIFAVVQGRFDSVFEGRGGTTIRAKKPLG